MPTCNMLERWRTGVLEYWNAGVLEYWNAGVLDLKTEIDLIFTLLPLVRQDSDGV